MKKTNIPSLFIAPASTDLSSIDVDLFEEKGRVVKLRDLLAKEIFDFDYILIDCPPSLNLLTINSMVASNSVLVPLQAEFFALEGLSQLLLTVRDIRSKINQDLKIHGIVLTMFDKRNNLSEQIEEDVRGNLGELVYDTVIPRNVRVSEAPSFSMPALIYDHKCSGAIAYQKLAAEFLKGKITLKEGKMSSKNERKKGLGRGLSSFLDVDGFDDIVERKKMKIRIKALLITQVICQ